MIEDMRGMAIKTYPARNIWNTGAVDDSSASHL